MRSLIQSLIPACRHQFSWPRRDDSGEHYQVCLHCGAKYSYDWATMRRVAPLEGCEEERPTPKTPRRKCGTKQAWVPRERRLKHQVPVLFRMRGGQEWVEGVSENVSRSGLLFRSASRLDLGAQVELVLEMPHELAGEDELRAACDGTVVRVEELPANRKNKPATYKIACSITHSRLLAAGE